MDATIHPLPPAEIPSPRGAVTVDGGIVTSWEEKGASPCSRSRWSYHGSSSSVTNSSILPARSIDAEELLLLLLLHRRCDLLIHRLAPPEVTPNNSGAASPRVSPLETNGFGAPAVHLRLHPSADVNQRTRWWSDSECVSCLPPQCVVCVVWCGVVCVAGPCRRGLTAARSAAERCCCCVQVQSEIMAPMWELLTLYPAAAALPFADRATIKQHHSLVS